MKKLLGKKVLITTIVILFTTVITTNFVFGGYSTNPVTKEDLKDVPYVAAQMTVNKNYKVRKAGGSKCEKIGIVYRNEAVKVLDVDKYGWAKIEFFSSDYYKLGRKKIDIGYVPACYTKAN